VPSKNSVKEYVAGGYYHIYNRGVNKRIIFKDQKDYSTFLSYLKTYLTPPPTADLQGLTLQVSPSKIPNNYFQEIELLAYCLMPNHFHLLVKQNSEHAISQFTKSITMKYVQYFNAKHKRVGPLFQGRYKAIHVENEYYLTYLSKYIHRNPLDLPVFRKNKLKKLESYKYSSYPNYLKLFNQSWINTKDILDLFSSTKTSNTYQNFVDISEGDDITLIKSVTLDNEF